MVNYDFKDIDDIDINDVNIKIISELEKGKSRVNINKLNNRLNKFADYALNEYDHRNINGANIHAIRCREIKYTLDFYKTHKWRAIEKAREYREEIKNKFIKGENITEDIAQIVRR